MNAIDVAKYIIHLASEDVANGGDPVTNLKLQKLLYYEQGFHIAAFGTPLFEDKIEAWTYGPVVPNVYYELKKYGNSPIELDDKIENLMLPNEEADFFVDVYDTYKIYSAIGLVNKTHNESPWIKAKANGMNSEITHELLREFFITKLE